MFLRENILVYMIFDTVTRIKLRKSQIGYNLVITSAVMQRFINIIMKINTVNNLLGYIRYKIIEAIYWNGKTHTKGFAYIPISPTKSHTVEKQMLRLR